MAWCPRAVGRQPRWARPRYCQVEPCSLPRRALDVQMTTEQSKALLDAEQPQPDLVLVLVIESVCRLKPDTLIAYLDMNGVTGPDCDLDIDPIDVGVLDRVEQKLADRLKEQNANTICLRVGSGVGGHTHDDVVLLLRPFCQPCQGGRQAANVQHRGKEIHTQCTCRLHRFLDVSASPLE